MDKSAHFLTDLLSLFGQLYTYIPYPRAFIRGEQDHNNGAVMPAAIEFWIKTYLTVWSYSKHQGIGAIVFAL
jgi:hypothetical protein